MKDTIIKGTGNSRTLGSVSDFLTLYPTYEAFAQALINKTLPVDLLGLNAAGVSQMGDSLNKANLLTDETAALYGLPNTAVPNDVFVKLSTSVSNKVVIGSYVGTQSLAWTNSGSLAGEWSEKTVGFRPTCVILLPANEVLYEKSYSSSKHYYYMNGGILGDGFPLSDEHDYAIGAEITNNGFRVRNALMANVGTNHDNYATMANQKNYWYRWVALR